MTLLVSWVGVDTHGTSSAYIAADSRISWSSLAKFDYGRKVFAFQHSGDILGYCGDVLFPTMVLSQISEMADRDLLFRNGTSSEGRYEVICRKLIQQFKEYPSMVKEITDSSLQVLFISRDPINNFRFGCWIIKWSREGGWSGQTIKLPSSSGVLFSLGSGANEFNQNLTRYQASQNSGTSRNIFHCFCDTLFNIKDENCGGAPQLVGIYRKPNSPAITYGIINNNKRYLLGIPIDNNVEFEKSEWRNNLFERCDGRTMKRIIEAQPQPDLMRRS
jgi:hypothetical protein